MSSYSRNSRKPTQALQLALAVALLAGSAAHAADEPRTFELTAFSNGAGGAALVSGDYNSAVRALSAHANGLNADTVNTNRCVAYVVTRQVEAARIACNDGRPRCAAANRDPADCRCPSTARTIATTSRWPIRIARYLTGCRTIRPPRSLT